MDNIVGFVVAITITLLAAGGVAKYFSGQFDDNELERVALEQARSLVRHKQVLDSFLLAKSEKEIDGEVTCTDLVDEGFLDEPEQCLDALGQTMSAWVSSPVGVPQSWIVGPASGGSDSALRLERIGVSSAQDAQRFSVLVSRNVARLTESQENGYIYYEDKQAFSKSDRDEAAAPVLPGNPPKVIDDNTLGAEGKWDSLAHYFPERVGIHTYTPGKFSNFVGTLWRQTGYWVWAADVRLNWPAECEYNCSAKMVFRDEGFSYACPANGVIPADWPGAARMEGGVPMLYHGGGGKNVFFDNVSSHAEDMASSTSICIPFSRTGYEMLTKDKVHVGSCSNPNNSSASSFCVPYKNAAGKHVGWMASCKNKACHTTGVGTGYHSKNNGNSGFRDLDYHNNSGWGKKSPNLYGSVRFLLPGGREYTLLTYLGMQYADNAVVDGVPPSVQMLMSNGRFLGEEVITVYSNLAPGKAWSPDTNADGTPGNRAVINLR